MGPEAQIQSAFPCYRLSWKTQDRVWRQKIPKREEELAEMERGEEESQVRQQLQEKERVHSGECTEGLGKRREILITVFDTMQFMGDLDNSNFNSIMGTRLIGVDGNQGKGKSAKQSTWDFLKRLLL